jgi:hypothetical protein
MSQISLAAEFPILEQQKYSTTVQSNTPKQLDLECVCFGLILVQFSRKNSQNFGQ